MPKYEVRQLFFVLEFLFWPLEVLYHHVLLSEAAYQTAQVHSAQQRLSLLIYGTVDVPVVHNDCIRPFGILLLAVQSHPL